MNDMTKGAILPHILKFAVFIFIAGLLQNLYLIVNSIILGQYLGKESIAAMGIAMTINFVVIGFIQGMTQGFSISLSQAYGARDMLKFRKYYYNSILLSIGLGLIISLLLSLINGYVLKLMNTPDHLFHMANIFLIVLYSGILALLFYNLFSAVLRSVGNSFSPILFLALSVVINIILVYIFVVILSGGIWSASLATIISQSIASIASYIYINKKYPDLRIKKEEKVADKKLMKRLITQAIPMGLQFSFTGIGVIVLQTFLNDFSTEHIAGFSIAIRIQNIFIFVFVALASSIATFIGQNYGAKNRQRIDRGVRIVSSLAIVLSILCAIIIKLFAPSMVGIFTKSPDPLIIQVANIYFDTVIWGYPILALLIVYRSALQGFGFPISAMFAGIIELTMRVLVVVSLTSSLGFFTIALADLLTWIVTGIALIIAYYYLTNPKRKQI
ncbi:MULTISPECIES: MATE family efflux transporter [unclassified Gemella]|uniref:MATE family efflux transporter n=1 Tax=unclassified Gemella TaxID=2624949 RepID=UPI00107488C0|nr:MULTISPECIES: MATE family efflux transporter [unclassified Gemella]MBF0710331.1 MATE family efflux transporter [Gemella sp. GL1.1]MBF0747007.1 MATE family efflux transporter [Gemella sp. 19428wG2_WT2a]NYS27675.1 MATE family efflux transporter [Gemella sp. GL1]TFU58823.1 MATE family efflux transporter [Gemella sp. WT2a]